MTQTKKTNMGYHDTSNSELSLSVHEDGTTFINLHNVKDLKGLKLSKIDKLKEGTLTKDLKFYCNGKWVVISLFGDKEEEE